MIKNHSILKEKYAPVLFAPFWSKFYSSAVYLLVSEVIVTSVSG